MNQPGFNIWRWLGPAGAHLARRFTGAPILASVLEDLPNADNRVTVEKTKLRITYQLGPGDTARRAVFRSAVRGVLRKLAPVTVSGTDDRKGLGHVCGTCRMGSDPDTTVVDRWNRAHDLENLYIADASFFPTSGGTNPALTIAANALRLGGEIGCRL
jgi:choline dehydrogenase-like flavoprotein